MNKPKVNKSSTAKLSSRSSPLNQSKSNVRGKSNSLNRPKKSKTTLEKSTRLPSSRVLSPVFDKSSDIVQSSRDESQKSVNIDNDTLSLSRNNNFQSGDSYLGNTMGDSIESIHKNDLLSLIKQDDTTRQLYNNAVKLIKRVQDIQLKKWGYVQLNKPHGSSSNSSVEKSSFIHTKANKRLKQNDVDNNITVKKGRRKDLLNNKLSSNNDDLYDGNSIIHTSQTKPTLNSAVTAHIASLFDSSSSQSSTTKTTQTMIPSSLLSKLSSLDYIQSMIHTHRSLFSMKHPSLALSLSRIKSNNNGIKSSFYKRNKYNMTPLSQLYRSYHKISAKQQPSRSLSTSVKQDNDDQDKDNASNNSDDDDDNNSNDANQHGNHSRFWQSNVDEPVIKVMTSDYFQRDSAEVSKEVKSWLLTLVKDEHGQPLTKFPHYMDVLLNDDAIFILYAPYIRNFLSKIVDLDMSSLFTIITDMTASHAFVKLQHMPKENPNSDTYTSKYVISYLFKTKLELFKDYPRTLHEATSYEECEYMIKSKADLDAPDTINGMTPLYRMIYNRQYDCVELLLKNKANIDIEEDNTSTPYKMRNNNGMILPLLLFAVNTPDLDIKYIKLLVDHNANINSAFDRRRGARILHHSVINNPKLIPSLLDMKAEIRYMDAYGETALDYAASSEDYLDALKAFIDYKIDINNVRGEKRSVLHSAAIDNVAGIKLLVDAKVDVEADGRRRSTPIHWAANNVNTLECMINYAKANINAIDKYSHSTLVKSSTPECIQLLIDSKADITGHTTHGWTPLSALASSEAPQATQCMELLINAKADVNEESQQGRIPIHHAARHDLECLKLLIKYKSNVNKQDKDGLTPLHRTVRGKPSFTMLFVGGFNPYNNMNNTDQHAHVLLEAKADVSLVDNDGQSPLHRAATMCKWKIISLLIDSKSDINLKDNDGYTPLYHIMKYGQHYSDDGDIQKTINLLIDNNASIDIMTKNDTTIRSILNSNNDKEFSKECKQILRDIINEKQI